MGANALLERLDALPPWRLPAVALLTGVLARRVEFFKLYHSPGLDAFRRTLSSVLLMGRFFSGWDIAAYWLAIAAGALLDQHIRQHLLSSPRPDRN